MSNGNYFMDLMTPEEQALMVRLSALSDLEPLCMRCSGPSWRKTILNAGKRSRLFFRTAWNALNPSWRRQPTARSP